MPIIKHPSITFGGFTLLASLVYALTQRTVIADHDAEKSSRASTRHQGELGVTGRDVLVFGSARMNPINQVTSLIERAEYSAAASKIVGLSVEEVLTLITYLETRKNFDREATASMLLEVCEEVAEENPRNALLLAGGFFYLPGLVAFENEVFKSWSEEGVAEIFDYLDAHATPVRSHHLAMVSSLVQKERREMLPEFLEWATQYSVDLTLDPDEANLAQNMFADIADQLTRFSSEQTLSEVSHFLANHIQNPSAAAQLASILEGSLVHDQVMADGWLQWLEDSGPNDQETSVMLTTAAIGGLTDHDPDHAVRLLSSPGFIERFTPPKGNAETDEQFESRRRVFFDELLGRFLQNTIADDPEGVLANAKEFYDPKRRASMEAWARDLIVSPHSASTQNTN